MTDPLPIVILVYDGAAADEAGALADVLDQAGLEVMIASVEANPVTSYHGRIVPRRSAEELGSCSALLIPGGMGVKSAATNERLLVSIGRLAARSTWLGATSTGSVILTAAGLADRARVTTHWLAGDLITERGVDLVDAPFVEHGRLLTASGLASSATLAFRLVGALLGSEAEQAARARHRPATGADDRYDRPAPWWRRWGRKEAVPDPKAIGSESTEMIVLDIDINSHDC